MKNILFLFSILFYLSAYSQINKEKFNAAKGIADEVVQYLSDEDYEQLHKLFAPKMAERLTTKKMEKMFSGFKSQYGVIKQTLKFSEKVTAEGIYYQQGIELEKENFTLLFSLDKENKMEGLRLTPYVPFYEWTPPSYASYDSFEETEFTIGELTPLLAKLTSPKGNVNQTIVVFVHGSGPNDMDESLGPNKLFKDLAYGLASNGISSIRYNKRSYDYASTLAKKQNEITIEELVVDDAVIAIRKAKELGAQKVILLGHSLGGHMAPMIAEREEVNGVIIMAGNVSPLHTLLVPQFEYIMKNESESGISEFQLNAIKAQVKNIEDDNYNKDTPAMALPLGLPASFWLSLKDYYPQKVAKKQEQPYLILNGGRDYQVTTSEAKKWKNGSKNKKSSTIIYPQLNHMFFSGEGILVPSEYEKEGHLNEQTLIDIINWSNAL